MRDEKGNITIKSVYKWFRSDKGKKYSFAIFYLIFFIVLFIFLGMPLKTNPSQDEEIVSLPFSTNYLENNNYNFTYKEIINEEEKLYNGEKNNNTIILTNDNKYEYIYQNGDLRPIDENTIDYYKLLDIYEIKKLVKDATLITKVEFPLTKETDFNYDVKSTKLNEFFNNDLYIEEDTNNKLIINCDEELNIKKITLDLYNYYKEENEDDVKSYLIEISYGGNV